MLLPAHENMVYKIHKEHFHGGGRCKKPRLETYNHFQQRRWFEKKLHFPGRMQIFLLSQIPLIKQALQVFITKYKPEKSVSQRKKRCEDVLKKRCEKDILVSDHCLDEKIFSIQLKTVDYSLFLFYYWHVSNIHHCGISRHCLMLKTQNSSLREGQILNALWEEGKEKKREIVIKQSY